MKGSEGESARSSRFCVPVTTPVFLKNSQGVSSCPPPHPLRSALKQVSSAEKGRAMVALEEMQARSEAAEAAPKAQLRAGGG